MARSPPSRPSPHHRSHRRWPSSGRYGRVGPRPGAFHELGNPSIVRKAGLIFPDYPQSSISDLPGRSARPGYRDLPSAYAGLRVLGTFHSGSLRDKDRVRTSLGAFRTGLDLPRGKFRRLENRLCRPGAQTVPWTWPTLGLPSPVAKSAANCAHIRAKAKISGFSECVAETVVAVELASGLRSLLTGICQRVFTNFASVVLPNVEKPHTFPIVGQQSPWFQNRERFSR